MKRMLRITPRLVILSFVDLGCYAREEKPRGHGASGRPLAVLPNAQIDMDRFFKYTPEQETAIQLLHRKFDVAAKPGAAANEPAVKAATDKIKQAWDAIRFAVPNEGKI